MSPPLFYIIRDISKSGGGSGHHSSGNSSGGGYSVGELEEMDMMDGVNKPKFRDLSLMGPLFIGSFPLTPPPLSATIHQVNIIFHRSSEQEGGQP